MAHLQIGATSPIAMQGTVFPVSMRNEAQARSLRIDDVSGGIRPLSTIATAEEGLNSQYYNEGLMALPGGILTLPYKSTAQTNLQTIGPASVDISAYRAASKRVHATMWSTSSGGRLIIAFGPNVYKDTSVSNPALTAPSTADNVTDNILAMWTAVINGSRAIVIGTDSTTDDIKFTADITANDITWSAGVTYAHANDRCFWGCYLPDLGWNVFGGIINQISGIYSFKGSTTTPLTSSTLTPTVLTQQATVTNPNATVLNTGAKSATSAITNVLPRTDQAGETAVLTPTNALVSDDSRATFATNTEIAASNNNGLFVSGFDFSSIPTDATITGLLLEVERSETDAAVNAFDVNVRMANSLGGANGASAGQLVSGVSFIGADKADTATEWPTTEAYKTYGGSTDTWSYNLTPAIVKNKGWGFFIRWQQAMVAAHNSGIDHVRATVYYQMAGIELNENNLGAGAGLIASGGYTIKDGPNPVNANQVVIVQPKADDATAVNVEREVIKLTFSYDSDSDRLLVTPARPPVSLPYVEDAFYYLGGVCAFGGPSSGPAKRAVMVTDDNQVYDLGFPQLNGSAAVRLVAGFPSGVAFYAWVCHADSTDCQLWIFFDGRWLPYGALFSKTLGGAMSTQPLAWAERTLATQQEQIVAVYPTSTNTSVMRQFAPANPFQDPHLTNTTQVKQDGPLSLTMPETALWPVENRNAILALQSQSRRIDDNTSYGSLRVRMDTAGDLTVASAEVDETFDAAAETFTDRNLASSNDPGKAFTTLVPKLTLDHQATSAETPNGLPLVLHTVSQEPFLPTLELRVESSPLTPKQLIDELSSKQATKAVQRFTGGGYDVPVVIEPIEAEWPATLGIAEPRWTDLKKPLVIRVRQVRGGLS